MVLPQRLCALATALVIVIAAAPPAKAGTAQVTGWLDLAEGGEGTITVAGWSADPDASVAAGVHVYVDGSFAVGGPATLYRPDVHRVTGLGEFHGFRFQFSASPGSHKVCVYGIDRTGDPNKLFGCRTVSVTGAVESSDAGSTPIGWLDVAEVKDRAIVVKGWTLDPDTTESIGVHVYVNGKFHSGFRADRSRPDVDRVFGLGELHGFNQTLALLPGWHTVCLYGIDRTGDRNALIDCAFAVIPFSDGAVITASGVVLPVLETRSDGWLVYTPCTNTYHLGFDEASLITDVDVVLDPGHGGTESGAAANGLVEKTLNLDISHRVKSRLEAAGYTVILTRYADFRLPLKARGAIAQGVHAEVFVSIHHNGGATAHLGRPGTMTLYQHNLPESRRLATLLWEEMYNEAREHPTQWVANSLTGASTRLSTSGGDFYGVHRYTPDIPSVITEWGYMTNSYEAAQLKTDTVKNAEADAITRAIVKWFETSEMGSGDIGSWTGSWSPGTGGTGGCVDPSLP